MELKRVVVTGLGAVTPIGNDVETTWNNAINGVSGAGPITQFDASKSKTQFACEVKDFDSSKYFDRKELRKADRYTQLAVAASEECIADSKMDFSKSNTNRIGVIVSAGIGGIKTFEDEVVSYAKNEELGPKFNPFFIPKMIPDIATGLISIRHGLRGPNFATVSACASSTHSIITAFDLIRLGKADAIIAGGAEAAVCVAGIGGFNSLTALSTRNDSPQTASRPFSASRDGFVLGEGAACLMLEELDHALARGAKIYGEIVGGGMSADAYHLTATHPDGIGAELVMRNALADANIDANEIDYVNVHGTSTPVGDPPELRAIKRVFGDQAYKMNISSTKSMTGHLLGGAGALETLLSTLAVKNDIVPPTINFTEGDEDPEIDYNLNLTLNKAQKREIRAALSNTFGFGGHNACVIVKKFKN